MLLSLPSLFTAFVLIGMLPSISASAQTEKNFSWKEHPKLSWDDYQGPVKATYEESAACTLSSIGFRRSTPDRSGRVKVIVYNQFKVEQSWVKPDAKIDSILTHEQGHFDLNEIYTRELTRRMKNVNVDSMDDIMKVYNQLMAEYSAKQNEYETQTAHGTNIVQQQKWTAAMNEILAKGE